MDLAEVEQAMSVLDGRHPGFARAEREKAQAAERRRTELEQLAVRTRRRNIRTAIMVRRCSSSSRAGRGSRENITRHDGARSRWSIHSRSASRRSASKR
jgi:hypothetical protein